MNLSDPNSWLGLAGLITAVLTAIGSLLVAKRSARKDEVSLLRNEVGRLQERITGLTDDVDLWQKRYNSLFNYVLVLRTCLVENNIEIPQSEELGDDEGEEVIRLTTPKSERRPRKKRIPGAKAPEDIGKPSEGKIKKEPEIDDTDEEPLNLG